MDNFIHNPLILNRVLPLSAKPLREARTPKPCGFFLNNRVILPRSLSLPRVTSSKNLSRGVDTQNEPWQNFWMDNLVIYGLIALAVGFFLAFSTSLYAIRRVAKFERAVRDLDWASLADLQIDVKKLIKNAQKHQANVNAAQKLTQKEKLAMAIDQAQQVVPMRYSANINQER